MITRDEFMDPLLDRIVYSKDNKKLATYGLEGYRYNEIPIEGYLKGYKIVDVRGLLDESGNSDEAYLKLIDKAINYLDKYDKVVVCCVAGISRSNAIAVGVLIKYFNIEFNDAINIVKDQISNCLIENAHINSLKRILIP